MNLLGYFNSSIALVLVFLLCFYCMVLRITKIPNIKILPPEAAGAWPIIGHLTQLAKPELPHIILGAMADKYGSIYSIRLGIHKAVVVSSWQIAKELFTTKDMVVATRPKLLATEIMGYNYALFAFASYGPYWREVRKMAVCELLSNQRVELLKHVPVTEVEAWLKELHKLWSSQKDGSGRVLVDMKKWFKDLILNVLLKVVAGKRLFGAGAEGDEEEARRCQKLISEVLHLFGVFVVRDAIPFLGWLDLGGHEKAMKEIAKKWDSLLGQWLEEHKRSRTNKEKDFMDVMRSHLDGKTLAGFDADTINKSTCLAMIVGGTDSNATTLVWSLSLLLNNRDALGKVKEELEINVGKGRPVQYSDISNLVYLQAVLKETLRLYPAIPLSGPREVIEDCTIGGYHVQKGTRLIMNLWKIQTDPSVWAEPLKFKPERFLETHTHVDFKGQNYQVIPFGGGRRGCPGVSFTMQVLPLALASFLHAFEFSTPSDALVDMTGSEGLANMKATPLEVLVSPRLSPEIYGSC